MNVTELFGMPLNKNEEKARELAKLIKEPLMESLELIIEQRCYIVLLAILNHLKK